MARSRWCLPARTSEYLKKSMAAQAKDHLSDLPAHMRLLLVSYLSAESLCRVDMVSPFWRSLSSPHEDDFALYTSLWRTLLERDFPVWSSSVDPQLPDNESYKRLFLARQRRKERESAFIAAANHKKIREKEESAAADAKYLATLSDADRARVLQERRLQQQQEDLRIAAQSVHLLRKSSVYATNRSGVATDAGDVPGSASPSRRRHSLPGKFQGRGGRGGRGMGSRLLLSHGGNY